MSWRPEPEPESEPAPCPTVETVILPRSADLGDGFTVRRVLPYARRRMVGPFVFFDRFGPTVFRAGIGLDVRPHPHIGLATLTYLFEGTILHRDSLGTVQTITPGAVNLMTAGRGIVHSERTPPGARDGTARLAGAQLWVALPRQFEEMAPGFAHHDATALPLIAGEGKRVRIVAGALYGARAPVETMSELFLADATLEAGARLEITAEHEERAVYVAAGAITLAGAEFAPDMLVVLKPGAAAVVVAQGPTRLLLLGGATLDGPRHIWWNFVASSPERIEAAKDDWRAGRFAAVPGETEFIPLPA